MVEVASSLGENGGVFDSDQNEVTLALRGGEFIELRRAPKREVADRILDQVMRLRVALQASG